MTSPTQEIPGERPAIAGYSTRRDQLALLVGFGLGSFAWNLCWPFLPLRVHDVGLANLNEVARAAGLLAGACNLLTALLGSGWVLLGERFGYRLQILRAHLGTALSMTLVGLAQSVVQLAGAVVVLGSLGGNYPHYLALASSRTAPSDVGRVVGDMQAAGQIGGTIGPLLGGLIAGRFGVPAAFVACSAASLVGLAVAFFGVRPDQPRHRDPTRPKGDARAAFARPGLRWLMLLFLIGDGSIQGLRPLIPIVISERLTDPAAIAATTGLCVTLATSGTVVAALIVGRISRRVAPRSILLITLPIAMIVAALVPVATTIPALLLAWLILGLASGVTTPAIFAWAGRVAPSGGGGAYALLAIASMMAYAVGPAMMGQASIYGLEWPFRVAAVLTGLAVLYILAGSPKPIAEPTPAAI